MIKLVILDMIVAVFKFILRTYGLNAKDCVLREMFVYQEDGYYSFCLRMFYVFFLSFYV